jgi:hypothetical protein
MCLRGRKWCHPTRRNALAVFRQCGFSMTRICWNTLSLSSYQTTILMCGRVIAVSMLAARLFLSPGSEPVLRGM